MALRNEIQRKIEKKQQEIIDLERDFHIQSAAAKAYLQALQDMLKSLPREGDAGLPIRVLRPHSIMSKAREAILVAGKPLHISEILRAVGKPVDSANKLSVGGSLATYVRKGEVFTRPKPNTFGLIELGHYKIEDENVASAPPEGFGTVRRKGSLLNFSEGEDDESLDDSHQDAPR